MNAQRLTAVYLIGTDFESKGKERLWAQIMLLMMVTFSLLPAGLEWNSYADIAGQIKGGSWRIQLQWLSVFGIAYLILFRRFKLIYEVLRRQNPFLIVMLVYSLLNIIWSAEPIISSKRVFQFVGIVATGMAFQMHERSGFDILKVMLVAVTSILVLSAGMAIIYPSIGYDAYFSKAWRGILDNKNDLGFVGALGLIFWIIRADTHGARWFFVLGGISLSILCIVMATSSTGIATAILGVAVYVLLRRSYVRSSLWLTRLLIGLVLLGLALLHVFFIMESRLPEWSEIIGPFAASFGKSSDLTGRTDIWAPVLLQFSKHPIGGIGWGAFWLGPGSASQPVIDTVGWTPFQAHNGYLDTLNELGGVGMGIFIAMLVLHGVRLVRMASEFPALAAFHTSILAIVLFTNFSESSFFRTTAFPYILLILSCISVSTWTKSSVSGQRELEDSRPEERKVNSYSSTMVLKKERG